MKRLTPIKAIRKHCIECSGGSRYEPKNCHLRDCPLWPYRLGHRPRNEPEPPRSCPLGAPESKLDGESHHAPA